MEKPREPGKAEGGEDAGDPGGVPGGSEANRRCRAHKVRSKLEQKQQKYATFRPFQKVGRRLLGHRSVIVIFELQKKLSILKTEIKNN